MSFPDDPTTLPVASLPTGEEPTLIWQDGQWKQIALKDRLTRAPGYRVMILAGDAGVNGRGDVIIESGPGRPEDDAGEFAMRAGDSSYDGINAGSFTMEAGDASGDGAKAGGFTLVIGAVTGNAEAGNFIVRNLPTSDPLVLDAWWVDGELIKRSAGP